MLTRRRLSGRLRAVLELDDPPRRIAIALAVGVFVGCTPFVGVQTLLSLVIALFTPMLILGVPLFDIAFVGVARVVTGKVASLHEWLAYTGKDHIHHRFAALGLTRPQSVLLIYFISATLGLSAMLLENATAREGVLVLLQAACVLAVVAILEYVGRGRSD